DELTIAYLKGAGLEKLKQQYKKDVELKYHIDQLKATVSIEARWITGEGDVSKLRSFETHMSKSIKPYSSFYNNDFYYMVYHSTEEKYTTSLLKHYAARYHNQGIEDMIFERWSKEKLKQQYKKDVELKYHIDQLKATVSIKARWNTGEGDVSKLRSFETHMSKSIKPYSSFYNNDFYYMVYHSTEEKYTTSLLKHYAARYHNQGIEDMIFERWSKEVHRYQIKALNGIHQWEDGRQDFFKAEISNISPGKVYSYKRIIYVVRVFVKDFNNTLLLFIQGTVIKNIVKDWQLGVESYQRTLNLTKPKLYFEAIDDRIPYTMSRAKKGVVYLNKHNRRSLMKLDEVHKFRDSTLIKIQENLIEMVTKNKLGRGQASIVEYMSLPIPLNKIWIPSASASIKACASGLCFHKFLLQYDLVVLDYHHLQDFMEI
nr:hypothetical protein [Tanacetum cinerariifolium]